MPSTVETIAFAEHLWVASLNSIPWAPYGVDVIGLGKFEERTKRDVAKNFIDDAGAAELHRVFQEHAFM